MGENWPSWRGPRRDGTSTEKSLPTKWTDDENNLWRLKLPGEGGATPIVWGDRVFVTSADGTDLVLICADTAGKQLWSRKVATGNREVRGDEGNSASPTPSTDGKWVWSMMATGDLACFDFEGTEIWKVNLQERYGRFNIQFGMTSSPVLEGDRLYLQLLHTSGAHVVALDKKTGKEIWGHQRQSDARDECEHSYASPFLYRDDKRSYLLTHGADYVVAHDLESGKEIWRCGGFHRGGNYNPTLRLVASPVAIPGLIVVPTAKNGPVLALRPHLTGDLTNNKKAIAWSLPANTPDVPSPLIHDNFVYLCRENGVLLCLNAKTGKEYYQQNTHRDRHRASPVYADGKIYLCARDGHVTVVKAGAKFQVLAKNNLKESLSASPAISNGRIYFRTYQSLIAIGKPDASAAR